MSLDSENMWLLPSDLTAARLARRQVERACADMPSDKLEVVRLLVTELVSNALRHGSGAVVLQVLRDGGAVEVAVEDESPETPVVVHPQSLQAHGAGMRLVEALADSWGISPRRHRGPGKRVWFLLD